MGHTAGKEVYRRLGEKVDNLTMRAAGSFTQRQRSRSILQSLERGTLQNQISDNPQRISHKFMRGFIGGFLKLPPVKRSLASDMLRSSFLGTIKKGITGQGKGWMTEV